MKLNHTMQSFGNELKKAIYESSVNSNTQAKIIEKISKRGYDKGFISGVFEGNVLLDSLSLMDLGVFAKAIYDVTNYEYINPSVYLEDIELKKVEKYKKETNKDTLEYPVVFENVRQVANDIWSIMLSAEEIANLGKSNMLNYEFETQREANIIETNEGVILTPTVNPTSLIEIEQKLLTDDFIPNTLTFNLPLRDRENFKWDANQKKWILLSGKLNIIDGYHRYLSITSATRKKKLNYNFEIRLTHFDDDKAKRFIVQEDKQNPISKEYIKSIDDSDLITQVINQLNENNRSDLKGKITTDRKSIHKGYALVSFEIMHKTIEKLWEINTVNEADELFDYLRVFFNGLIGMHQEEFKPRFKSLNNDYTISNERMFILYLIAAKQFKNNDNWRDNLKRTIYNINMNDDLLKEYIDVQYSVINNRFNKYFKMANDILGVITDDRQII